MISVACSKVNLKNEDVKEYEAAKASWMAERAAHCHASTSVSSATNAESAAAASKNSPSSKKEEQRKRIGVPQASAKKGR